MKREESGNQDFLKVLPAPEEKFMCVDPGRMDIYGQPMDGIHVRVKVEGKRVLYFSYGYIKGYPTCFGASLTLEDACGVIATLLPYEEQQKESCV